MKRIIYALKCPITKSVHYIGKSTQGFIRPLQHIKYSHSIKIREWVQDIGVLGRIPDIEILENVADCDELDRRERYWISEYLNKGALLLNETLITTVTIRTDLDERLSCADFDQYKEIGRFIAERRKKAKLTQDEFAKRAGVALTVVRKIEQGKTNLGLSSIITMLRMFGCTIGVKIPIRDKHTKQYLQD